MRLGRLMKTAADAEALARALVSTAQGAVMTTALITDMSQPLATAAGNALEVIEVMETLTGTSVNRAPWDTMGLGGEALALGGLAADPADGAGRIEQALQSGPPPNGSGPSGCRPGRPADFVERWPDRLPPRYKSDPRGSQPWRGLCAGHRRSAWPCRGGLSGGGRQREGIVLNLSVGLSDLAGIGEDIGSGDPLCMVHAATEAQAEEAIRMVQSAYVLAESTPRPGPDYERIA